MSRVGNPYDNAKAERFMRTLKAEQIDYTLFRERQHAKRSIGNFIERIYNDQRLHTALGYRSPRSSSSHRAAAAGAALRAAGASRRPRPIASLTPKNPKQTKPRNPPPSNRSSRSLRNPPTAN